jgi:hypothetical protein|tara:strand:- start:2410 stop:3369 length:960 start_codon:yes stop_codon:yes gene_type:complete
MGATLNPPTKFRQDDPYKDYYVVPAPHSNPLVIDWKGKIGYGDVISPICYAMNMAEKNQCDVVLNFHWASKSPQKYKPEDEETIQDFADYIANNTKPVEMFEFTMNHVYDSKLGFNHDNYDTAGPDDRNQFMGLHNMRFSTFGLSDGNTLVNGGEKVATIVSTIKHKQTLKEYGKEWKDPLGFSPSGAKKIVNAWPKAINMIRKRDWKVMTVHYEDPISVCVKRMLGSNVVIGYHGAHMWLARWLGMPMIVFSKGGKQRANITPRAFPWAIHYEYWSDFNIDSISEHILMSIAKRDAEIEKLRYYKTNPNLYRLRQERT